MRTAWVLVLLLSSGCVTTEMTRRLAFSTVPGAPPTLAGSSGIGMRFTTLTEPPKSQGAGGAVAFPMFQPDLGLVVQLGPRSFIGGKVAVVSAGFGATAPLGGLTTPTSSMALEAAMGAGHDLPVTANFGVAFAAELGLSALSLTTAASVTETHVEFLPAARLAVGAYYTTGALRFYAGGTVGTSVRNDATSLRTVDCRARLPCSTTETGSLGVAGVSMLGGGVRWQASSFTSISLEAWVPVSGDGTHFPVMISLALRMGDFFSALSERHRTKPARRPPAPSPEPEPAPEFAPQL